MKYPEYDSPLELVMNNITTQMAKNIDEMCWKAVQRVGINVDEEKLLIALKQDSERYREAYANGYETGYEKRDDEIVRCKDCKWRSYYCTEATDGTTMYTCHYPCANDVPRPADWFCADGERRTDDA